MLAACLAGVSYYFVCVDGYPKAGMIFTILLIFISLLDIISALYLGVSIYSIKKLITKRNLIIDTKIMVVQAVTFALYLLSIIVFCISFGNREFLFSADMAYNFCSSLA